MHHACVWWLFQMTLKIHVTWIFKLTTYHSNLLWYMRDSTPFPRISSRVSLAYIQKTVHKNLVGRIRTEKQANSQSPLKPLLGKKVGLELKKPTPVGKGKEAASLPSWPVLALIADVLALYRCSLKLYLFWFVSWLRAGAHSSSDLWHPNLHGQRLLWSLTAWLP